jgi:kumamolisin
MPLLNRPIAVFAGACLWLGFVGNLRALAPSMVPLPNSTQTVEVGGTSTKHVRPYISRGTLTSAEKSAPLNFNVVLKMRHLAELQDRINHGEHISLREMAAKYEPLPSDYEAVADWLTQSGLSITKRDSHHMVIFARGSVAQVAQAMSVKFARVTANGKEYTSAITAPSVPAAISSLLTGVNGLQPHIRAHKNLIRPSEQPNATGGNTSYTPAQIASAYGVTGLYSKSIIGSGQTIAIVIDTFPSTTDLVQFWKTVGISQSISNIQFIQAVQGELPSPSGEETLDTEWASSMAPGAKVRVYAATDLSDADLDAAYQQVYDDVTNHPELHLDQMTMSYGEGETYTTQAQVNTTDQYFAELAAAGVTIFASSGDGDCSPGANGAGDTSGPVQVETPASDPNVTGVGGTTLNLDANNNVTSETVWNNGSGGTGGGTSIYFSRPKWQVGTGVPAGTMREVPDVAAAADPDTGAQFYFQGSLQVVGGTSWSSPTWAGICSLMNQARANAGQSTLGILGVSIYPTLSGSGYATSFRDITSGNNGTGVSSGYSANVGYDECTGLGAPLAAGLAQTLIGSATLVGAQFSAPEVAVIPGQEAAFSVVVGGASATYQWQAEAVGSSTFTTLSDGDGIAGSASANLTISSATLAMSGERFECAISLNGLMVTTTPSVLAVETPLTVSTFAGTVGTAGRTNGTGLAAEFNFPSGVVCDSSGDIFVADFVNNEIREITPTGSTSTPYGSLSGAGGSSNSTGNNAKFDEPNSVAIDSQGDLYVADTTNNLVRKISGGAVTTFGGTNQFSLPGGVACDGAGNVYVADTGHDVIRKITSAGTVSTLAGVLNSAGYRDGAHTQALFNAPTALAVDSSGNVYVADFGNSVVREISTAGTVSTLAGQGVVAGYLDGPGGTALFNAPTGIAVDASNNVYVTDSLVPPQGSNAVGNSLVRKITQAGVVTTLAGQPGSEGTSDGTGTAAAFNSVQALTFNGSGTMILADTYSQTIREGIVLPIVSIAATQPTADVFGPVTGQFTVSRTGATTANLTVNYMTSGTGVSNTDYSALAGTVTAHRAPRR